MHVYIVLIMCTYTVTTFRVCILQSCTMSVCVAIMYCVRLYSSRVLCLSVLQSCTMSVCPYSDCSVWGKNDQCWGITACCLHLEIAPSLISLMVSVDVKHHVYLLISKCNYLSLTFYPIAVIWRFMTGVNVWRVYLASQNIRSAIVLTLGNKVVEYCTVLEWVNEMHLKPNLVQPPSQKSTNTSILSEANEVLTSSSIFLFLCSSSTGELSLLSKARS